MVFPGIQVIRRATVKEQAKLPVFACWGYNVIVLKAQTLLFAELD